MAATWSLWILWMIFACFASCITADDAPPVDCSNVVLYLTGCLSFVREGSAVQKPEGSCCSGLKTVLKTNADCLCQAFKNSAQVGVKLNVTKAMTLPAACRLDAPSVGNCTSSFDSAAAPAPSPSGLSPSFIPGTPTSGIGVHEISPPPPGSASYSPVPSVCLLILASAAFYNLI